MSLADTADSLRKIKLFHNLNPVHQSLLAHSLQYRCVPPKHSLFCQKQKGEAVYFILSGSVNVCIEEADGRDVLLAICGEGEILGEISAIDGYGHSASVTTREHSQFLWLDCLTFRHYLQTLPHLACNLADIVVQRLRRSTAQTHALAHLDIPGRVAYQLLAFARDYGHAASLDDTPLIDSVRAQDDTPMHRLSTAEDLPMSPITIPIQLRQSDLAALVGATRESVNKALGIYRRSGVITVTDHRITIHKPAALERQVR